jgi:tripartite-type tricarboxylate transporter receptor subunit TctC
MRARIIVLAVVFLSLRGVFPALAASAGYPSKPLEIIVPFSAGSDSDLSARVVADVGSKHFGQPMVVIDKPGGAGAIAVADVISSRPDGYKALWEAHAYFATTVKTQKVPFDVNDLVPIANFYEIKLGLAVRGDSPFKTFDDLRDYAKKHPGQLKWANSGRGTGLYLSALLLFRKAGLNIVDVPYKGSGETGIALLGGHADVASIAIGAIVDQVKAGKIRLLVLFSDKRYADHLNVPTAGDLGFPDAALPSYWGIYVRKDVPEPIKKALTDVSRKIAEDPDFPKGIERVGGQPRYANPDFIRASTRKLEEIGVPILKELGLYVER